MCVANHPRALFITIYRIYLKSGAYYFFRDLRSILTTEVSGKKEIIHRRKTIALLQKGLEVQGFVDPKNIPKFERQNRTAQVIFLKYSIWK